MKKNNAIVFACLGPPCVGKDTLAESFTSVFGAEHIPIVNTGDLLRKFDPGSTPRFLEVKKQMAAGDVADPETVMEILALSIDDIWTPVSEQAHMLMLTGSPRTLEEAMWWEHSVLSQLGIEKFVPCELFADREVLESRRAKRFAEGGPRVQEDHPEVYANRRRKFEAQTRPVIKHYGSRHMVQPIDCNGTPAENFREALAVLKRYQIAEPALVV